MASAQPLVVLGHQPPTGATVLVIHDQYLVSSALAYTLRDKGFNAHSLQVTDLAAVQKAAVTHAPGLVLFDLSSGPDGHSIDSADLIGPLRAQGWTVMVIAGMTSLDGIADAVARALSPSLP